MMHLLASLVLLAAAQAPSRPAAPTTPITQAPYRVGPSDVLSVRVFNEADLTGSYNIDSDGSITFPYLERVSVAGLTVKDIEEKIQAGLRAGFVRQAQVSVDITNYRSRSILVMGEVRLPGEYKISGPVTLLELIARAGSLLPSAGPVLTVLRRRDGIAAAAPQPSPGAPLNVDSLRIAYDDLREGRPQANIMLQDGDTIFVPVADRFYISGFVKSPGTFVLVPGLTVQQALSMAGGLTERGSTRGVFCVTSPTISLSPKASTLILAFCPTSTLSIDVSSTLTSTLIDDISAMVKSAVDERLATAKVPTFDGISAMTPLIGATCNVLSRWFFCPRRTADCWFTRDWLDETFKLAVSTARRASRTAIACWSSRALASLIASVCDLSRDWAFRSAISA